MAIVTPRFERRRRHLSGGRAIVLTTVMAALLAAVLVPNVPTNDQVRAGDQAPRTYRAGQDLIYESVVLTDSSDGVPLDTSSWPWQRAARYEEILPTSHRENADQGADRGRRLR